MVENIQNYILRSMQDGYNLLAPITYDDKPLCYFLMKNYGKQKERVARPCVEKFIRENRLDYKKTTNWHIWSLRDD